MAGRQGCRERAAWFPSRRNESGADMPTNEEEDAQTYTVVINDEEQYSIWPSHKDIPRGWRSVGHQGRKSECLKYIDEVWTDMRPLSLRRKMEPGRKNES